MAAPPARKVRSRVANRRTPGRAAARSTIAEGTSSWRSPDMARVLLRQPGLNRRNRREAGAGDDHHANPHPRHLAGGCHDEERHGDNTDERLAYGDELIARIVALRRDRVERTRQHDGRKI